MRIEGRLLRLAARLIALYLRFAAFSSRWRIQGGEAVEALIRAGQPVLLAFWHGRLAMIPYAYRRAGGRRVHILISEHRDGELIAEAMRHWGYEAVRGSSRQGAVKGARGMLRAARAGSDLAITPDGPRGPRESVQEGVIELARLSGLPIVPVTFSSRPHRFLSSWDRFLLPLPFGHGVILWGQPLQVARESGEETLSALRVELETRMRALNRRADALASGARA